MVKKVNPLLGTLSTLDAIVKGNAHRQNALTTELATHTIDTVVGFDSLMWETGIEPKDMEWVIVEQYENENAARKGHERWVKTLIEHPETQLKDIDLWGLKDEEV